MRTYPKSHGTTRAHKEIKHRAPRSLENVDCVNLGLHGAVCVHSAFTLIRKCCACIICIRRTKAPSERINSDEAHISSAGQKPFARPPTMNCSNKEPRGGLVG